MSEQPAIEYAELLRSLRAEAGLTQDELAAAARVSPRTVSDLERGINLTPRRATAELLADALHLTGPKREQFMAARRRPAATPDAVSTGAGKPDDDVDPSNVVWIESAASSRFVDREEELGVLRKAWSSAQAGHRVLALIAGEPGIGKTALTAELARLVHADGGLVLYGRWDEHVTAPYQAFREALNDYARASPDAVLRRDLDGLAEEIARLCPEPAHRVGASTAPAHAAAEAERFRLFESLDTWIRRVAARHPVLLVLDDLQWADQPSLFLLPYLMRASRLTPLLVVAMYRDVGPERSEFSAALPSLTRDIDCRRLTLRGLEHHAVIALLEDTAGRPFSERESVMVAELEWETEGNPFFLLEMARHLSEIGAFDRDVVRLAETPAEIPQSVRDMVRSRLRRLSDRCVELLAIASLIGERFDAALLASAASLAEGATVHLLEEAARAGPDRGGRRRAGLLAVLALPDTKGDLRGTEQEPSGPAASADRRDTPVPSRCLPGRTRAPLRRGREQGLRAAGGPVRVPGREARAARGGGRGRGASLQEGARAAGSLRAGGRGAPMRGAP